MADVLTLIPLFVVSAILESIAHICLKKGSLRCAMKSGGQYYLAVMTTGYVWLGIFAYLIEMLVWLYILSRLPLSIAFPASGIQKIVMVLLAVFVLREPMKKREGIAMVLIGIGLACAFFSTKT